LRVPGKLTTDIPFWCHVLVYLIKMGYLSTRIDILFKHLTILIHGEVPKHFGGGVILIVCYLIYCMLSSVLGNKNSTFYFVSGWTSLCLPS